MSDTAGSGIAMVIDIIVVAVLAFYVIKFIISSTIFLLSEENNA